MPRITDARLRDLERKIPKPPPAITVIRRAVEPGPDGQRRDCGIIAVRRSRHGAVPIDIIFDAPRTDLDGDALTNMTDDEIMGLAP